MWITNVMFLSPPLQELLDNECTSPGTAQKFHNKSDLHCSNDSFTSSNDTTHGEGHNEISAEEANKFREVLETRCPESNAASSPLASKLTRNNSQSSIEREIAALNREMEQIQLECQEIVDMHVKEQTRIKTDAVSASAVRSPRMVPRMGTRLDYIRQLHALQHEHSPDWGHKEVLANGHIYERVGPAPPQDKVRSAAVDRLKEKDTSTTSAYNTGDSCRSTPLTLELQPGGADPRNNNSMLCLTAPLPLKPSHSDSEKLALPGTGPGCNGLPPPNGKEWSSDGDGRVAKSQSSTSVSRMSQTGPDSVGASGPQDTQPDSLQDLYAQYADVMYTNRENLQHTIMVQQKLFQQQIMQKHAAAVASNSLKEVGKDLSGKPPPLPPPNGSQQQHGSPSRGDKDKSGSPQQGSPSHQAAGTSEVEAPTMEYVVKRRADGTRYIARRPIRSRMLKERAKKINEERCGMTTDDDAMSEMKVGRYWNKVERKRHVEKSRQRKEKARAKMETLKEDSEQGGKETAQAQLNIVELSHRKMMKHKGKKVFDDFTTIQEMMVHGARDSGKASYNPLLSVTTV